MSTNIRFTELEPATGPRYLDLTFPAYRHLLSLKPAPPHRGEEDLGEIHPIAIGAELDSKPVGLALGGAPSGGSGAAEVLSVFVRPAQRRRGVGEELMERLEEALRRAGAQRARTVYMTGKPGTAIFEHLIQQRGWSEPVPRMITLKATMEQAVRMPWYRRYRPRNGLEIISWKDVGDTEYRSLRRSQEEDPWIPEDLVPWNFDRRGFEEISSVGARMGGGIVGWVVNHCINPETIRFTCSYIRSDLARRGRIVALYSEAIRRLSETGVRRCVFTTPMHFPDMVTFVQRRIAPWATALEETRGATKELV